MIQDLANYRLPADWSPGAPRWKLALWLVVGQVLLASELPGTPWRRWLLISFGARIGNGCRLKPRLRVKSPWRLVVGDHCWLGENVWIDNLAPVTLADRVCLSQGAFLCTGNHDYRSRGFELTLGPIQVGAEAWICARAVLAPGTVVGAGAVIGLGAVASGRVAPGQIMAGNPAVVVGQRQTRAIAQPPSILIIVPTLNSHPLLPRLVASLRAQTFTHWRVLFIDGPSSAEHRAHLQHLCAADQRFSWQEQDPARPGIFGAMNQGFGQASPSDWLLFWGSDDWAASPTALEQAAAATTACDLLVGQGRYASLNAGGEPVPGRRTAFRWRHSYRLSLFLGSTPPHQATLIGPGSRQRLASYRAGFRLSADLDYFLELSRSQGLRVKLLPVELVRMAVAGISGVQHRRRLQEVRQAYRRAFGVLWWFPFLLRYLQRAGSAVRPRLRGLPSRKEAEPCPDC